MGLLYVASISTFTLIISYILFKRAAGSLSILQPNMISYIFYYNLILQTFLASILIVLHADGEHYVISRVSENARIYGWISVCYMMIAMPIGMLLAKNIFSRNSSIKRRLYNYTSKEIDLKYIGHTPLKYSIWVFTIISSISCLYVFYIIGYFPLTKIFNLSFFEAAELRIASGRNFSGNVYIKNFFASLMMPILSYVWLLYYIKTKNALDLLIFLISFFLSLSILYYDFSKAPILFYILSFIILYYYAKGYVDKKLAFLGFFIVIILIIIMYNYMGVSSNELLHYNSGPIGRILLGQAGGLYLMLDIFPHDYPFIGLASISELLSNILGIEYIDRAARTAMIEFNPRGVALGLAGVMNSVYIGEAWANFGLLGIILAPLWVGFVIESLYIFFLKSPKSPLHLAFFVSFSVGGAVTGGFNDYIYNPTIILILTFFLAVYLLAHTFKKIA